MEASTICERCKIFTTSLSYIFSCKHSLCLQCLLRIIAFDHIQNILTQDQIQVTCPCKLGTKLITLADLPQENVNVTSTCNLHKAAAMFYCLKCEVWLCEICMEMHQLYFPNHQLSQEESCFTKCEIHEGMKKDYFCHDCQEILCPTCNGLKGSKHSTHNYQLIKDYATELRKHIPQCDVSAQVQRIDNLRIDFSRQVDNALAKTLQKMDELIQVIEESKLIYKDKMRQTLQRADLFLNLLKSCYLDFNKSNVTLDIHLLNDLTKWNIRKEVQHLELSTTAGKKMKELEDDLKQYLKMPSIETIQVNTWKKLLNENEIKNTLTLTGHTSYVWSLIQLEDGRIASGSGDGTIKIWEVKENEIKNTLTLTGHTSYVWSLIQLEDGRIASGSYDCTIKIWEVKENEIKNTLTLTGHTRSVYSLIQLEDGRIASGSQDNTIKIWEVKENEIKNTLTLTGHTSYVWSLIQLEDGRLASGSDDNTIKIWEVKQNEIKNTLTLTGHTNPVYSLIQLEDGRIASGSADCTIKIWEVKQNEIKNTLTHTGHTGCVRSLIQLEDGRIASGSDDCTIKIWEVKQNEIKNTLTLTGHTDYVNSLIQLEDGRIVSGSDDKTIKVWG